ncbi:MAG: 4Fe-4S binding protein [Candidatus Lokiarchaeota archaeon]|nr:4Fe-4S binding protein [Candidatus Lokiarchaeota archaeon]
MGYFKKLLKFRRLLTFLWFLVLPITFNWMSPVLIIMGGLEGYLTLSFLIFSIWFISSLFVGRAYCAYGCQWGAAQEVLGYIVPKSLDSSKKGKRRKIKYIVFVLWIIFVALGPILNMGYFNGFSAYYPTPTDATGIISWNGVSIGLFIFYFGIIGSVVILFGLVGGNRAFCNYACPMGVLGVIGTKIMTLIKYPALHLEADPEKCTQCKQCSKACVMGLDVHELVESGKMYDADCILCGSCVATCNQDTIKYAWKWKKRSK